LDHFERGRLLLTGVQMMVVDEADRMLDMGFIPDLERIFKMTPAKKQTLFFSATMPPEITRLTTQFLNDPTRIEASRPATTGENITQFVTKMPIGDAKAKRMVLRALIERSEVSNGIIFCNRKSEVDIVAKSLKVHGLDALPIHGDLDQSMRTKTLESFRKGELKLLVASDVAARGLDIPAVSHVFNYDVPHHSEDYVHRIGRTGRAGRLGETYMIVTPNDLKNYEKVIKLTKKEPELVTVDLDWDEAKAAGERDTERRKAKGPARGGDRDRSRSRDSRGEPRSRPVKDHGERASMEALTPAPAMDEAAVAAPTEARPERTPRTGRRPRRDENRPPREAAPAAAEAAPLAARERSAEPAQRPSYGERSEGRPSRARTERPERSERQERDRSAGDSRSQRDDNGPQVIGFGADTPAFLMRGPSLAKR
jgi:superfamily II DNA/RNA helicase